MAPVHPFQPALALSDLTAAMLNSLPIHNIADLLELGCQHKQQHPEFLLTGIRPPFAQNRSPNLNSGATH